MDAIPTTLIPQFQSKIFREIGSLVEHKASGTETTGYAMILELFGFDQSLC